MTGRAMGDCAGAAPSAGLGWRGGGFGRGLGRGFGFGRGRRAGQPSAIEDTARPGAPELEQLRRQATALEQALGELNARLERLEGPAARTDK